MSVYSECLEEDIQFNESELHNYARGIGIDPDYEHELMEIAQEGLKSTVPKPWKIIQDENNNIFYYNPENKFSTYDHPNDDRFRIKVMLARRLRKQQLIAHMMNSPHETMENPRMETRSALVRTLNTETQFTNETSGSHTNYTEILPTLKSSLHEKPLPDSTTPDKSKKNARLIDADKDKSDDSSLTESMNIEKGSHQAYIPITGPEVGMSPTQNSGPNDFDQGQKPSQAVNEPRKTAIKSWLCDTTMNTEALASDTEASENGISANTSYAELAIHPDANLGLSNKSRTGSLSGNQTLIELSALDDLKMTLKLDIGQIRKKMDNLKMSYKKLKNELTSKESSLEHIERASRPSTPNLETRVSKNHRMTDGSISRSQFSRRPTLVSSSISTPKQDRIKITPKCTTSTQIENHEIETICNELSKSTII
ncbi:hypothetical protein Ciccas_004991 [Cichlidogyrus casuarinus]|uniref:WW domain-containing protein n=1 Tax=Cichlidogyrus casuarinus TaxID=1844966 RepID=A0ABD2QA05_9PLAT